MGCLSAGPGHTHTHLYLQTAALRDHHPAPRLCLPRRGRGVPPGSERMARRRDTAAGAIAGPAAPVPGHSPGEAAVTKPRCQVCTSKRRIVVTERRAEMKGSGTIGLRGGTVWRAQGAGWWRRFGLALAGCLLVAPMGQT